MKGITRQAIIDLARADGIPVREGNFSLVETYGAQEAFLTGTFGVVTPVSAIDGRQIGEGCMGPVSSRLRRLYYDMVRA
jgi:branched-chain amino acid aminotransferase